MARVIEDLQLHVVPLVALHLVAGGRIGIEVGDLSRPHIVFEVTPAALGPFTLQVAGRDGDLVGRGADDSLVSDPVRIRAEEVDVAIVGISGRRHLFERVQMLFPAADRIVQLGVLRIADSREVIAIEERPVGRQFVALVAVAKSV